MSPNSRNAAQGVELLVLGALLAVTQDGLLGDASRYVTAPGTRF